MRAECDELLAAERTRAASLEQELEAVRGKMDVLKKAVEDRRKDIADLRCVGRQLCECLTVKQGLRLSARVFFRHER